MAEVSEATVVSVSLYEVSPRIADELKEDFCEFSVCSEGAGKDPVFLWIFRSH